MAAELVKLVAGVIGERVARRLGQHPSELYKLLTPLGIGELFLEGEKQAEVPFHEEVLTEFLDEDEEDE